MTSTTGRGPTAVTALLVRLLVVLSMLLVISPGTAVAAQTEVAFPFRLKFSADVHGSVIVRGNTSMTCVDSAQCTAARGTTVGEKTSNNDFSSTFVDVDADPTTFNSSSTTLSLPAGGSVLYAALVWSGDAGKKSTDTAPVPDVTSRSKVKFKTPRQSGYSTVTATGAGWTSFGSGERFPYQGFVDVTAAVRAAGSGVYSVADVQASLGVDRYAGWALIVAVSDPVAPLRNLTVFQGFGPVEAGGDVRIPVSGFLTPAQGTVRTTLGLVAWEGDAGVVGDQLRLDDKPLSDAANPPGNTFNSTITELGVDVGGRNPSYANSLGVDVELLSADGLLRPGATGATLGLTSTVETYYPGVLTFATELFEPMLEGTKSVVDVNGGDTGPGDELEYSVVLRSTGGEDALRSRFVDAVPTGTTYVPGSLSLDGVPLTDTSGDDLGSADASRVVVNLGSGATSSTGGRMVAAASTTAVVRFRVRIADGLRGGYQLTNIANAQFVGAVTGIQHAAASTTAITTTAPVVDLHRPTAVADVVEFLPTAATPSVSIPVLENDAPGVSGERLRVVAVTAPAGGRAVVDATGTRITYTPGTTAAGRDAFTYTVADPRGLNASATVAVTVLNSAPTPAADTARTPAGTPVDVAVLANDSDPNGDALTLDSVSVPGSGTATVVGNSVRYVPAAGFRGTATFSYRVRDSRGATASAQVTVTVENRAPLAVADAYPLQGGGQVPVNLLANDSDPDGDPLTAVLVTPAAHGTLVLNANGTGTYTPAAGFRGTDSFTYAAVDGQPVNPRSAPVRVTLSVNGAPVANTVNGTTPGGRAVVVGHAATDPDGDPLTLSAIGNPAHGAAVVTSDGRISYTPGVGWAGPDTFSYTVSDGRGATATGQVTIVVENSTPVARDDSGATRPGHAVTIDVVANDSDENIGTTVQELSVTDVRILAGRAAVAWSGRNVTVTPERGSTDAVDLEYTVSDGAGGTATARLRIALTLNGPVALPDGPVRILTSGTVLIDVLANDVDPALTDAPDPLAVQPGSVSVPGPVDTRGRPAGTAVVEGGQIRFTARQGFTGRATFTYAATDGTVASGPTTVTVDVANVAPVVTRTPTASAAHGELVTIDVLPDVDDENVASGDQALTVVRASSLHATVAVRPGGVLEIRPEPRFKGALVVEYDVADDLGATATGEVHLQVANAVPVAVADHARTTGPVVLDVTGNDEDDNEDDLTVVPGTLSAPREVSPVGEGSRPLARAGGQVELLADGSVRFTPSAGSLGAVSFDYVVTDGDDLASATVTIEVLAAPLPVPAPTAVPSATPTAVPSATPTAVPTVTPTAAPTADPGVAPTPGPVDAPTSSPVQERPTAPVVTPGATAAPAAGTSVTTAGPGQGTSAPSAGAVAVLARTGAEPGVLLALAGGLLLVGTTLLATTRPRPARTTRWARR